MSVVFLDSLPGITRTSGTSKYSGLLADLDANPNTFAYIEGPIAGHYNVATNLNSGKVAGVSENDYEFVARTLTTEQASDFGLPLPEDTGEVDKDGNPVIHDGYVFGRRIEGETQAEVLKAREERKAKAAATREKNGTAPGRKSGKSKG